MVNDFMTKQEIIRQINTAIAERFEIAVTDIHPDEIIRHKLDLNSLSVLEMVVVIKRQYGVTITPRELSGVVTFDDLYDYLFEKLKDK